MKGDMTMRYKITGRHIEVTDALKEAIEHKFDKLSKYFKEDTEVRVALSVQRGLHKIEVTIPTKQGIIRTEQTSSDMYASIDLVQTVIEKQIKKYKNKLIDKKQNIHSFSDLFMEEVAEEPEEEIEIVKNKRFAVKPMDPIEACMQMELLGHDFFVFLNAQSDGISVVYKRKDGKYGIIEPEY